jgi:hypothetical protein
VRLVLGNPGLTGKIFSPNFRHGILARGLLQRGDELRCGREEPVLLRLGAADLDQGREPSGSTAIITCCRLPEAISAAPPAVI